MDKQPTIKFAAMGLPALFALAACAGSPAAEPQHRVEVSEHRSDFHQTHSKASWSFQTVRDADGHDWPSGMTVSVHAEQRVVGGPRSQWLEFRADELLPGDDLEAAFALAAENQRRLSADCTRARLSVDGQPVALEVAGVRVAAYGDRDRMPVPPTDVGGHPLEQRVGRLPPERIVLSTQVRIRPGQAQFRQLASAGSVEYDLCGMTGRMRSAELDGLQQVYEWGRD